MFSTERCGNTGSIVHWFNWMRKVAHPRKSDIAQDGVIAFCSYLLLGLIVG